MHNEFKSKIEHFVAQSSRVLTPQGKENPNIKFISKQLILLIVIIKIIRKWNLFLTNKISLCICTPCTIKIFKTIVLIIISNDLSIYCIFHKNKNVFQCKFFFIKPRNMHLLNKLSLIKTKIHRKIETTLYPFSQISQLNFKTTVYPQLIWLNILTQPPIGGGQRLRRYGAVLNLQLFEFYSRILRGNTEIIRHFTELTELFLAFLTLHQIYEMSKINNLLKLSFTY